MDSDNDANAPARPLQAGDVTLIVPVWNGGVAFTRCLDALGALDPAPGRVLVVDDGSTDDSAACARDMGATVLQTSRPRSGPGQARNLGAARAAGSILFFLDADVLCKPDAIARVVADFLADEELAAVYGSYDDRPPAPNFVSQYKNLLHHYVHQDSSGQATSFWAGCGAIRRDLFLQLGGFSSEYPRPSIEDIELGYRLKKAGYRTKLDKELQVTHLKKWTLGSLLVSDFRDRALPWTRLILRDREFPADLNLRISHRLSVVVVYLLVFLLVAAVGFPLALAGAAVCALALLALNWRLYGFFAARRGIAFAAGAVLLHWLYYLYSGLAFIIGVGQWVLGLSKPAGASPTELSIPTGKRLA